MPFYLVQHGLALDKAVDPDRPLSPSGESRTRAIAEPLAAGGLTVQRVYHSGKTRARQTAEIFAAALNNPPVAAHEFLNPGDDPALVLPHLSSHSMYVGHLPHMQKLASLVLCHDPDARTVHFENSAVICIGREEGEYYLDWFLKPSLLPAR